MTIDPSDTDRLTPPDMVTFERPPTSKEECIEFLVDVAVEADRVDGVRTARKEMVSA